MYFLVGSSYILSTIILFIGLFYFIQYAERSHMREWTRCLGLKFFGRINNKIYKILCRYIFQQLLMLSEMITGMLEGLLGLEPMVKLIITNNTEIQTDKIEINDIVMDEIKKLIVPQVKLLEFENNIIKTNDKEIKENNIIKTNDEDIKEDNKSINKEIKENNIIKTNDEIKENPKIDIISDSLESEGILKRFKISKKVIDAKQTIDVPAKNIFVKSSEAKMEDDNMSLKSNRSKDQPDNLDIIDSEIQSNKFIDSPTSIKKIIRNKNIKTVIKKDGNKIRVSVTKKQKN